MTSFKHTPISDVSTTKVGEPQKSAMASLFAGAYDFAADMEQAPVWTASALPTVICLAGVSGRQAHRAFPLPPTAMRTLSALPAGDHIFEISGAVLRLQIPVSGIKTYAVLLPLDQLFDLRLSAARGFCHWLNGRRPVPLQMMPLNQRKRLALALRALDGRLANASYRDIASALFGLGDATGRAWKGHDLRDRTIRLVRLGKGLMAGGYRQLLLYPHRRKLSGLF